MAWWVIVLLLIAAFGPVLWVMPSRRDRLLTRLRAGARSRGLLVELTQLPDLAAPAQERVTAGGKPRDPTLACAAYRHPLPRAVNHAPRWRLLASAVADRPLPGWTFDGEPAGDGAYWSQLESRLEALPASTLGVEAARNHVSVYWRERVAPDEVDSCLDALAVALQGLAEWHWDVEQRELERLSQEQRDSD